MGRRTLHLKLTIELDMLDRIVIAALYESGGIADSQLCEGFLQGRIRGLLDTLVADYLTQHPIWQEYLRHG